MTLATRKAVLLAKVESSFGVDATPSASTDAMLVEAPVPSLEVTQLTRNNVRNTLSKEPSVAGRKIQRLAFQYEVRNNGNLTATVPPAVGVLLRGCSFAQTQRTGASGTIASAAVPDSVTPPTGTFTYTKTTAYAGYMFRRVKLVCTTPGASGTAAFTVTAPAVGQLPAYSATGVVMTSSSPFALPNSAVITPTVGTSFASGDTFYIDLYPVSYEYTPTSDIDAMASLTLYLYLDGVLHKFTGARGTFSVDAPGGEYAKFSFEFTGNYIAVTDASMPASPVYETKKPNQVELAGLVVGGNNAFKASKFAIEMANDVVIRDDINADESYAGVMIVNRAPTVSFDPEMTVVATHDFFGNLSAGTELFAQMSVGIEKGNTVSFVMPNIQYNNLTYGDRNGLRTIEVQGGLTTTTADNELSLIFS